MNSPSPFRNQDLRTKAEILRNDLKVDALAPVDAIKLASSGIIQNLTVVHYPFGRGISGMCIKSDGGSLIAINSTMSIGRQNFSMAHELFHLYYDTTPGTIICSTEIGRGNDTERQADQFASFFLIPPAALYKLVEPATENGRSLTIENIVSFEQHFLVSRRAILYRLVGEERLNRTQAEVMGQGVGRSARALGYSDALYRMSPKNEQMATAGYYMAQAKELLDKDLISDSKYSELMRAALRAEPGCDKDSKGVEVVD
jgi:Zn-dependent peptidase ImmA (M78 family)